MNRKKKIFVNKYKKSAKHEQKKVDILKYQNKKFPNRIRKKKLIFAMTSKLPRNLLGIQEKSKSKKTGRNGWNISIRFGIQEF